MQKCHLVTKIRDYNFQGHYNDNRNILYTLAVLCHRLDTILYSASRQESNCKLSSNAYKGDEIRFTLSTTVLECVAEFMGYITIGFA